ncbi:MAG: UDP-N-acetylmuramoyl-tripeptide--D-alanyl-D-alanine ligase [bacterium]
MFKISDLHKNIKENNIIFIGKEDVLISSVEHDTRRIQKGALYVAIKGDNLDGHDFVNDAVAKGAVACLVSKKIKNVDIPQIIVSDTVYTYGEIAKYWRKKIKYPIVALTGSNGKTTTKDIIYTILAHKHKVCRTQGNFNNLIGLPYTLLSFSKDAEYGIVEMGMNAKGEVARLSEIADPDFALVTNVGRAHIGKLGSIEAVLAAKMELFDYMLKKDKNLFVVNASDKLISEWISEHNVKSKITYSCPPLKGADINVEQISEDFEQQGFKVSSKDGRVVTGNIQLSGIHNLYNVTAGIAAAFSLGIKIDDAAQALRTFIPPSMRSNVVLRDGVKYLVDCYNANPDSMTAAINTGIKVDGVKRHLAIVGDMLELDDFSAQLHQEIGSLLAQKKYDHVFVIGNYAEDYKKGFLKYSSVDGISSYKSEDILTLKKDIKAFIKSGDFVLLKASRGMKLETILN